MSGRRCAIALALSLTAAGLAPAQAARKADPDKLPSSRVQDLHYGEVLFQFYAGDDFQALTELEAFSQWQRMPHHTADADLLSGGLYLSLGMHNEAARRFEQLLTDDLPVRVRNRAWFYLAKIWYERGYYDRSEAALERIQGTLGAELDAERNHVLVNALMRQQRYDDAITQLKAFQGTSDWMAYARFNLGVALVRAGRLPEAAPILTAVGTLNTSSDEMLNLRDKANLALGYAYLQANQSAQARAPLERVRLNGPYSSRALLGDGYAHAELGEYQAALTPWLELHQRNLLDAAVQESYLAVPYAFGKLNADAQSAEYYEAALKSFASESQNLDTAIAKLGGGHMLEDLLGEDKDARYGWFWQLKALPDVPQSRYLYTVLADNDFQEGLKNYRDMAFLQGTLRKWDQSMEAFAAMTETRTRAYAERLPRTDALLQSDAPTRLRAARAEVGSRLDAVETADDVAALGTPSERAQWARLAGLEEQVATLPASPERDEARDKLRLIKGVLSWQLDAKFKARSYDERHSLHELDAALEELQNRWVRVQQARATVPSDTSQFAARIAALAARVHDMREGLAAASSAQDQYLEGVAVAQLRAQQQRLEDYAIQARFALAGIYDRAADQAGDAPAAPAAPAGRPERP
jgi:lipopolysaccharide biosynthesis regulator YciM